MNDNDRHYVARCLACCESANLAGFSGARGGSHEVSSRDHHDLRYLPLLIVETAARDPLTEKLAEQQ